jgi:hypothetical protein
MGAGCCSFLSGGQNEQGYFVVIGTATVSAVCYFALFTTKQVETSISTKK